MTDFSGDVFRPGFSLAYTVVMKRFPDIERDPRILERIERLAKADGFNRRDAFAFARAYGAACASEFDGPRVGAVISYAGSIVGVGTNKMKSDPAQHVFDLRWRKFNNVDVCGSFPQNMGAVHAEVSAWKNVPYTVAESMNRKRAKVYIYRIAPGLEHGQGLARPCPACAHYLAEMGLRRVYYSTEYGFASETLDI